MWTENENTAWLISWLESQVAEYPYYRPYDTWRRYPVNMTEDGGNDYHKKRGIAATTNYKDARSKYYEFGYNELYIGQAIEKILGLLEKRYNLDFGELEEECYSIQYGLYDDDDDDDE